MTDCAETCGGLTKVTLTPEDARAMVEQARFLLSLKSARREALEDAFEDAGIATRAQMRAHDTERAPPLEVFANVNHHGGVVTLAAQTFSNAADEARAADNAALKARLTDAQNTQNMNAQERYALDQRRAATDAEREMRRIQRGISDE